LVPFTAASAMADQRTFKLARAKPVTGYIQHIIHAPDNP
jgi:hypothetical protein